MEANPGERMASEKRRTLHDGGDTKTVKGEDMNERLRANGAHPSRQGEVFKPAEASTAEQSTEPRKFRHYPQPWKFAEEGYNGGPAVLDANGNVLVSLFWPTHPPEETGEAEQETYALGKAIAKLCESGRVGESPAPKKEAARILVEGLPFNLSAYKQGEIVKIMLKFCGGGQ